MKTLDELGIAPAPWSVRDILPIGQGRDDVTGKWLVDGDGNDLVMDIDGNSIEEITATANLISAAPELYQCLHEAVIAFCLDRSCSRHRNGEVCIHPDVGCPAYQWRAVLDKAAGESESK